MIFVRWIWSFRTSALRLLQGLGIYWALLMLTVCITMLMWGRDCITAFTLLSEMTLSMLAKKKLFLSLTSIIFPPWRLLFELSSEK